MRDTEHVFIIDSDTRTKTTNWVKESDQQPLRREQNHDHKEAIELGIDADYVVLSGGQLDTCGTI
jgi:hypothetical protein